MAEPTIPAVFGAGATQDGTTLTINKADLVAVGLTADASNTAESLLTAIILLAKSALTEDGFNTNLDQSLTVADGFSSIVQRDDGTGTFVNYRQSQLTVSLHTADSFSLDPDDF
ncbi:MAG: hypothetical protein AAF773_20340 [Cyanobacteria bacterium P01_D01_bin.115]